MSEDRHSLSAPRPINNVCSEGDETDESGGSQLAWEVDVYRTGVDTPVDTLRIDNTTLPPRVNKKGKVVWRLPTEEGKLPNFGTDERRRIMELFKERKKSRRKKGSKQSSKPPSDNTSNNNSNSNQKGVSGSDSKEKGTPAKEKANGKEKKTRVTAAAALAARRKKNNAAAAVPVEAAAAADDPTSNIADTQPLQTHPPGFQNGDSKQTPEHDSKNGPTNKSDNQNSPEEPPPPEQKPHIKPPDSRYIVIPEHERPPPLPSSTSDTTSLPSLAVHAAKRFVDLYYPHVTHGLSNDLAMHYTPTAQKSVSVGGAHSVVTGRHDIAMQIASLSGAAFVVRGVVAQDTFDQKGAHILVTGLVTMALSPSDQILHQTTMAPFAHSVSLTPATANSTNTLTDHLYAFQIHNDALSLLTAEAEITANNPSSQTQFHQTQHHVQQRPPHTQSGPHPPPPGLFG